MVACRHAGAISSSPSTDFEALIVGAGISGIAIAIELLRTGRTSFLVLEHAEDLGGTWRDNTYPGVAVDIPSVSYSFAYETGYPWSRRFARGEEVQRYIRHCAKKYGVEDHIRYGARVKRCAFEEMEDRWAVHLEGSGGEEVMRCSFLVAATGILREPQFPDIRDRDCFAGPAFHTARWDHSCDLAGLRVGVVGTGASAVQVVPAIAPRAARLSVFQRTPVWVTPRFFAGPLEAGCLQHRSGLYRRLARAFYGTVFEGYTFALTTYWAFPSFLVRAFHALVRRSMRSQLADPEIARRLAPRYDFGCKRPAFSNTYLGTFNRSNTELVSSGIDRVCPEGIVTRDGRLHELDAIVWATGFRTTERGNVPNFEVRGAAGLELGGFWEDHRFQAFAGIAVPGFPNFFLASGPYSGGINWFAMLEAHAALMLQCMDKARAVGATRVEVDRGAHDRYMRYMWRRADGAVFKTPSCAATGSYYLDRRGDASLPLPHTPWWRSFRQAPAFGLARGFRFSSGRPNGASVAAAAGARDAASPASRRARRRCGAREAET